jgi:hypothetical protein
MRPLGLTRALILCLCLAGPTAVVAAADLVLVREGKPQAQIVTAAQPGRKTRLAAAELQTYIQKISGATLPIVTEPASDVPVTIYLGNSEHTDRLKLAGRELRHGAFRIVSGERWLALLGNDDNYVPIEPYARSRGERNTVNAKLDAISNDTFENPYAAHYRSYHAELDLWTFDGAGPLNAAYDLLRQLGVRWYMAGELGEVVPTAKDIVVPAVDRTVKPDFNLRRFSFFHDHLGVSKDDMLWRLRLGMNEGYDILGAVQAGHGAKFVFGRPEMKQKYPEMYAIWGGKRQFDHRGKVGAPCLSSPDLFREHLAFAHLIFNHYREPMLSLDVVDGYAYLCECDRCRDLGSRHRNWNGTLSDYYWSYINRVAAELYKSHPDRMVSGLAYSAYQLPPEKIEQLSPNVAVVVCQTRNTFGQRATRELFEALRKQWLAKLPSGKLYIWDYYLTAQPGRPYEGLPVYFPRLIAQDLRALKGVSEGESIEVYDHAPGRDNFTWDDQAVNHLNLYVTTRLQWNVGEDLGAMLAEYYASFYGPAASAMQQFIEYSEANYDQMRTNLEPVEKALALLATAKQAAGEGVHAQRVAMVEEFCKPMHRLREQLKVGRQDAMELRALKHPLKSFTLDGKLDEAQWDQVRRNEFVEARTGKTPAQRTTVRYAWADDSLLLGIRCEDSDIANINRSPLGNEDANIFQRDNLDILIETPVHSFYQIVVSPTGQVMDLDRSTGLNSEWSGNVTVATQIDDAGWTAEIRIPAAGEEARDLNALVGVAGRTPSITYPWFINIGRQHVRGSDTQFWTLSPLGDSKFRDVMKFAKLYVK